MTVNKNKEGGQTGEESQEQIQTTTLPTQGVGVGGGVSTVPLAAFCEQWFRYTRAREDARSAQ